MPVSGLVISLTVLLLAGCGKDSLSSRKHVNTQDLSVGSADKKGVLSNDASNPEEDVR